MTLDSKELLSPSIKILDPRGEPTKWLGAVLLDLLEQDTEESKEALKWAFPRMAQWLEEGGETDEHVAALMRELPPE